MIPVRHRLISLQPEERKMELRKHPFFKQHVEVRSGTGLIAMDRGGVSDPYLKCIQGRFE